MSDQQHTAEPWKAKLSKTIHPNTKMYWLNENTSIGTENEHDASRIVACVNACAGIDTETLEIAAEYNVANDDAEWEPPHPIFKLANERDELSDHDRVCFMDQSINIGRTAIAKAEAAS